MAEDLDKPLLDPENFCRDGIDLERLPLEEVFEQLRTSARGLSSDDAEARLHIFGYNKLEEKTVSNSNIDRDQVILFAARAARMETQDAIDAAITNMLADPKEVGLKSALQSCCSHVLLLFCYILVINA